MNEPYTQADMDAVSDSPELTDEELATARPFAEVFPAFEGNPPPNPRE